MIFFRWRVAAGESDLVVVVVSCMCVVDRFICGVVVDVDGT